MFRYEKIAHIAGGHILEPWDFKPRPIQTANIALLAITPFDDDSTQRISSLSNLHLRALLL